MSTLMVSISGIRGIIGSGLTPEVVVSFARAFGTYCNGGKVVVGRDSRVSGEMLLNLISGGLLSTGCDVVDLGIAPTPTTQLATEHLEANGGIIITASHNPVMWNGLKLLAADGLFLDEEQGNRVLKIRASGDYASKTWSELGLVSRFDRAVEDHLRRVLQLRQIEVEKIRARRFKIVVDTVNGAGGVIFPQLLEQLGCEAIFLNREPTGRFSRNPEPTAENLTELGEAVLANHADLGLAVDPDADRLALVSEQGAPLGEEYTLALAVDFWLRRRPGTVVVNVSTSRVIDDVAAKHGSRVERTRVGEINVAKRMREISAIIGGEGNGGVILPEVHLGRDAIVGAAIILQSLASFHGPLSELHGSLPQYVMCRRKVELSDRAKIAQLLEAAASRYQHETLDMTDGLKLLRDRSWVHVRASNTEPIVRLMAEAPTAEAAESLCREMQQLADEIV